MRVITLATVLFLVAVSAGCGSSRRAVVVSASATLNRGGNGSVSAISCGAPGNCAAGGYYRQGPASKMEAFVVSETNGTWGKAIAVRGAATPGSVGGSRVLAISCAAAGECAAGGYYRAGGYGSQAFVVSETNASWGKAIAVPGLPTVNVDAHVTSISCAATGECAAGGFYLGRSGYEAFVISETNGSWGKAIKIPGTALLNAGHFASLLSISCAAPGECAAGGYYFDRNSDSQAFVVDETNGSWGNAIEAPGTAKSPNGDAKVTSISCAAGGECAAGGPYPDRNSSWQAFVVDETNGSWGSAIEVPGTKTLNTGARAMVNSISCAAAGSCAAGGSYSDDSGNQQAFVAAETNGNWGTAIEVPGTATLNTGGAAEVDSISCAAAGDCAAGGYYTGSEGGQAFVVSETNGSWGTAIQVPGTATPNSGKAHVNSISCAAAGDCAAGGFYATQAVVVSETNGSWGNAILAGSLPASCLVPRVVGGAIWGAKRRLNAAGCGVGKITNVYSSARKGRVLAQQPKPGKILSAGARVALTVSKGKKP